MLLRVRTAAKGPTDRIGVCQPSLFVLGEFSGDLRRKTVSDHAPGGFSLFAVSVFAGPILSAGQRSLCCTKHLLYRIDCKRKTSTYVKSAQAPFLSLSRISRYLLRVDDDRTVPAAAVCAGRALGLLEFYQKLPPVFVEFFSLLVRLELFFRKTGGGAKASPGFP